MSSHQALDRLDALAGVSWFSHTGAYPCGDATTRVESRTEAMELVFSVDWENARTEFANTTAGKHCALVLNRGRDRVRTKDISAAIG